MSATAADIMKKKIIADLYETGGPSRCNDHPRNNTDHPIAFQVLVEPRLQIFQRAAGSRHNTTDVRDVVGAAICTPDSILVGACDFPGDLIAGRCLLGAYRCDGAKLSGYHGRTGILQLRSTPAADAIKIIIIADLD